MFALRSLARVAGFAVAGVALAGAIYNALVIADARERAAMSAYTAQSLAAFLPDVMDDTGGKVSPLEMRDTVEAYETLRAGLADPAAILAAISAAVSQNPGIRVEAIEWGPAGPVAGAEPDESLDEEPLEGEATADPAAAMRPGAVTVTVAGRIEPFDGAYPRAFDELQSFMRALRALPAVERVRAAREPLDVNPASTLSGEIARDAAPAQAAFTVEIMMRSGHDTV
ncbi:MAG: hypothetical protein L6Q83_09940 [Gammaproteobacteria bacterium]|nr:hypothetical protein [Gammaproteobacteria bacterium]